MATPAGYADVSLRFNLGGYNRPAYITFGLDPSDTDPTAIAAAVGNAWNTTMRSTLDSNVVMTECLVRLGTDGGEDLVGSALFSAAGSASGTSVPRNVAVLVYKRTARGGRRGRGRFYIPWSIAGTFITEDGVIQTTQFNNLQSGASAFLSALNAASQPMVVLHNPGQTTQGPPNVVTSLVVSPVVATQRRRLIR